MPEVRGQKSEIRSQRSVVRNQVSDVRGQKSDVRSQMSDVRILSLATELHSKSPITHRPSPVSSIKVRKTNSEIRINVSSGEPHSPFNPAEHLHPPTVGATVTRDSTSLRIQPRITSASSFCQRICSAGLRFAAHSTFNIQHSKFHSPITYIKVRKTKLEIRISESPGEPHSTFNIQHSTFHSPISYIKVRKTNLEIRINVSPGEPHSPFNIQNSKFHLPITHYPLPITHA